MSGLLSLLSMTARSLDAQRFGLDVVGQNIANVNTEGYTKRVALFSAVPAPEKRTAGDGVQIDGVRSMRDRLIDRQLWTELSDEQQAATLDATLSVVEVAIGAPGESIDAALDAFFDSFAGLAEDPTSLTARQEVLYQGQALASQFRDMFSQLSGIQRDADGGVRTTVDQVNALVARIADLNARVGGTSPASTEGLVLRDEINQAIEDLSRLVDINVIETPEGTYNIDFAGGRALVVGKFGYPVEIQDEPVTGLARIVSGGFDVTAQAIGGTLGGHLNARDVKLPGYLSLLDQLAVDVATRVNEVHSTGYGLAGSTGIAFFTIGSPPGAASLSVNASLLEAGGTDLVAASSSPTLPGDNGNARLLAGIRDEELASGLTASEAWSQLVYQVGRDKQAVEDTVQLQSEVTRQIRNLQDAVSGVSLDEEAADLIRFQRSYEANARYFTTIDETLTTLMDMV